ncbi:MAG: hypothetical protein M1829_001267 [Trizodia sp. TS-e1964]|nr:MAG: hypothetical protein M1829_001267 [Trizodia sp. TS-e1964]
MAPSAALSSLSRYRPAVLFLTGFAAAYAIYYIQSQYFSGSKSTHRLKRRSAVRRNSHRRSTGSRDENSQPEPLEDITASPEEAVAQFELRTAQAREEGTDFGTLAYTTADGREIAFPLSFTSLRTPEQLQSDHSISPDEAQKARDTLEQAILFSLLQAWPHLTFPTAIHSRIIDGLVAMGFLSKNVDEALRQYAMRHSPDTFPTAANNASETEADQDSNFSWRIDDSLAVREGQSLLNLVYLIAEDQARREGYVHRGVTCNSCGSMPIRGIRYRCSNCVDFDLCETCEAMQVHPRTHLFFKVRIPAPFLGNPRQAQPVWYPGKPSSMPQNISPTLNKRLANETNFHCSEVEALWDQFKCLAASEWWEDPNRLGMAMDRRTFDKCFVPNASIRPPPPNLIYDRMFAFYDTNGDGLIGFEEFLKGLASLNNKNKSERWKRIFQGYDIDGDGFVDRKDFLRMFRAFYALSKELTRDMVAGMDDEAADESGTRGIILGSQPISSAFAGSIPQGELSRLREGKERHSSGDFLVTDSGGVARESADDTGDRNVIIGDAAEKQDLNNSVNRLGELLDGSLQVATTSAPIGGDSASSEAEGEKGEDDDEDENATALSENYWAKHVIPEDIIKALGELYPISTIQDNRIRRMVLLATAERLRLGDSEQRAKVRLVGIEERWKRREFYLDEEEGGSAPEGYEGGIDSTFFSTNMTAPQPVLTNASHPPTPRSRSSSKVRFQEDLTDNDYETRSNPSTSSRSIPVGERWGGFEVPEAERDVGKEILYQVAQQGLNEMLDALFVEKEDLAMEVLTTREERDELRPLFKSIPDSKLSGRKDFAKKSALKGKRRQKIKPRPTIIDMSDLPGNPEGVGGHPFAPRERFAPDLLSEPDALWASMQSSAGFTLESLADPNGPFSESSSLRSSLIYPNPWDLANMGPNVVFFPARIPQITDPSLSKNPSDVPPASPAERLAMLQQSTAFTTMPPSEELLARLKFLDGVELEIKQRGGPGRLSFAEFEKIMQGDEGKKLEFVGGWIDIASF